MATSSGPVSEVPPFQTVLEEDGKVRIPPELVRSMGIRAGDIVNLDFARIGSGPKSYKEAEAELGYAQGYELAVSTLKFFLPIWLKNFKENLPYFVTDAKSFADIPPTEGPKKRCVVVANGPSLYETDLRPLREFTGTVVCANKPLAHLLRNGIVPDWVTALDAQEVVMESFDHDIVREYCQRLRFILPTMVHPSVTRFVVENAGRDRIYWANPHFSDDVAPNISETLNNITNIPSCDHGGNVGTFSYLMAIRPMLCKPIGLLGFDMSLRPNPKWTVEETAQYRFFYLPHKDSFYAMTPPFEFYMHRLLDLWQDSRSVGSITFNLTPVGPLNAVIGLRSTTLERFIRCQENSPGLEPA